MKNDGAKFHDGVTSEAAQARHDAYHNMLAAIHRINPKAVPVARPDEPYAIVRLAEQRRQTVAPAERPASPESTLRVRVSNMQGACAALVAEAKRKGVPAELQTYDDADLGRQLQLYNARHDELEKKIAYFNSTTQEQRAIDDLRADLRGINKRIDAMGAALAALGDLLPLLMQRAEREPSDAN